MPIVFAEQPVQVPVVLERHDDTRLRSSHLLAQTRGRWPSNASQVAGLLKNRRIARMHTRHPSTIPGSRHQAGTVSPTCTLPARLLALAATIATSATRPRSAESAGAWTACR